MIRGRPHTIIDGLVFPESPRWHNGMLWIVDMYAYQVLTVDSTGTPRVVAAFDDIPAGLGFLPDGRALVALRNSRRVVSVRHDAVSLHLDLTAFAASSLNDMVIDGHGRAFVDCIMSADRGASSSDRIVVFDLDSVPRVAASGLASPNGLALSADRRSLVVASTWRCELIAMSVSDDGALGDRRLFAGTGDSTPDGVCLDAAGAVWTGGLASGRFLRVLPTGEIIESIEVGDRWAIACTLGGADRRTLFMTVSATIWPPDHNTRGSILALDVEVPGTGWP
ncbi:MAG TPA: SMP-30/gluconolactonase/LRE family protein [Acidothermaceae bacterium]|jgi:sugar lactone lactonase YvrE|nr:SMP-30/gluconolactonase/LRE family protein [Acidothermaceae bacterium]